MQELQASLNKVIVFYKSPFEASEKRQSLKKGKLTEDNRTKGVLSLKARARLKNCIEKLIDTYTVGRNKTIKDILTRKPLLTFITLTLPHKQEHSDKEIKRYALNPFLQILQIRYNVTAYIWRAEKQKNGNIHFHIITNRIISWKKIREEWNTIINRLGYVDRYREKMLKVSLDDYIKLRKAKSQEEVRKAKKAYEQGCKEDWTNPNSTDIHKIRGINNLSAYITKYMAKSEGEENAGIEGHLWGRSDNLKEINKYQTMLDKRDIDKLEKAKSEGKCKYMKDEYFEVYILNKTNILELNLSFLNEYIEHCNNNFERLEEPPKLKSSNKLTA